jgi:hypothetical protein
LRERQAFTLVEGVDPIDCYKGRIDAENLIERILRHDQATLAVQQLRLYAVHNNQLMRSGRPLELEPSKPYPGLKNLSSMRFRQTFRMIMARFNRQLSTARARKAD